MPFAVSNAYEASSAAKYSLQVRLLAPVILTITSFGVQAEIANTNLLQQRAFDPITALFGLPPAAARLSTSRELQWSLVHANVFVGGQESGEALVLDGEISQFALRYRQRFGRCWQLAAHGALVAHSGGVFDRAIDDWHQWFGLPDAMRDESPYFDLNLGYANNGRQGRELSVASQGPGDLHFSLQRYLGCTNNGAILRLGLKLPTGDAETFLGSGETDIYADIQSKVWVFHKVWSAGATAGVMLPGKVDDLAEQRNIVGFGAFGLQYQFWPRASALIQVDWHTALFKSELRELGSFAAQLSFGMRIATLGGHSLDITMAEDAVIDTAPDVALRIAWTHRLHR